MICFSTNQNMYRALPQMAFRSILRHNWMHRKHHTKYNRLLDFHNRPQIIKRHPKSSETHLQTSATYKPAFALRKIRIIILLCFRSCTLLISDMITPKIPFRLISMLLDWLYTHESLAKYCMKPLLSVDRCDDVVSKTGWWLMICMALELTWTWSYLTTPWIA